MSKEDQQRLAILSEKITPYEKEQYRTKKYYQEQYEKYKELNKKELARLESSQ